MKRLLNFLCIALMLLVLTSCREESCSGYVVGKHYESARNIPRYDAATHTTRMQHIPEHWVVYVADSCRVRRLNVDKATFGKTKLGEFVNFKTGKDGKEKDKAR